MLPGTHVYLDYSSAIPYNGEEYETSVGGARVSSIAVRISVGDQDTGIKMAYQTSPLSVRHTENDPGELRWHGEETNLRIDHDSTSLQGELYAVLENPHEVAAVALGGASPTRTGRVIAVACVDLSHTRDGYNYSRFVTPESTLGIKDHSDGDRKSETEEGIPQQNVLGQLVLRLDWPSGEAEASSDSVILVVHGASGLAIEANR